MSTRVAVDEIGVTRTEKLLAFVLAGFLLLGGLWIYHRLQRPEYVNVAPPPPAQAQALNQFQRAQERVSRAGDAVGSARQRLELTREAYRTALEAKQPAARLAAQYRRAQATYARAQAQASAARAEVRSEAPAAAAIERRLDAARERHAHDARRATFLLRLGYVLATLAASFLLLGWLRRRRSRYLPVGLAAVGAASVQALVMAGDYLGDYIDVGRSGPFLIAAAGIVMTLLAFWSLQRYLAKHIPARRVRKHECPLCGYPVAASPRCEGCGRHVVSECSSCGSQRRVGTAHCGLCGAG